MAKVIKSVKIQWQWGGAGYDPYSIRGFNVALSEVIAGASSPYKQVLAQSTVLDKDARDHTFLNLTFDDQTQYMGWVQAIYDDQDSDWVSNTSLILNDDGSCTITVYNDVKDTIQMVDNMSLDNQLTPVEKLEVKKDWEIIKGEYSKLTTEADTFTELTTYQTYKDRYSELQTYINGLLANMTTTTEIVGDNFRSNFKTYYDARVTLQSELASKKASIAQTNAINTASADATAKANQAETNAKGYADTVAGNAQTNAVSTILGGIMTDVNTIKVGSDQKTVIDKEYGITITDANDSNKKIRINSGGIILTTDNFSTVKQAITPSGIVSDAVIVGSSNNLKAILDGYMTPDYTLIKGSSLVNGSVDTSKLTVTTRGDNLVLNPEFETMQGAGTLEGWYVESGLLTEVWNKLPSDSNPEITLVTDATAPTGTSALKQSGTKINYIRGEKIVVDTTKRYKFEASAKKDPITSDVAQVQIGIICYDANGSEISRRYPVCTTTALTTSWKTWSVTITGTGLTHSQFATGTKYIAPYMVLDTTGSARIHIGSYGVYQIQLTSITGDMIETGQVDTSKMIIGQKQDINLVQDGDFKNYETSLWTKHANISKISVTSPVNSYAVSVRDADIWLVSDQNIPVYGNKEYRFEVTVRKNPNSTVNPRIYIGYMCKRADYSIIGGRTGTFDYYVAYVSLTSTEWVTYTCTLKGFSGSYSDATTTFNTGTVYFSPAVICNYQQGVGAITDVAMYKVYDVTAGLDNNYIYLTNSSINMQGRNNVKLNQDGLYIGKYDATKEVRLTDGDLQFFRNGQKVWQTGRVYSALLQDNASINLVDDQLWEPERLEKASVMLTPVGDEHWIRYMITNNKVMERKLSYIKRSDGKGFIINNKVYDTYGGSTLGSLYGTYNLDTDTGVVTSSTFTTGNANSTTITATLSALLYIVCPAGRQISVSAQCSLYTRKYGTSTWTYSGGRGLTANVDKRQAYFGWQGTADQFSNVSFTCNPPEIPANTEFIFQIDNVSVQSNDNLYNTGYRITCSLTSWTYTSYSIANNGYYQGANMPCYVTVVG